MLGAHPDCVATPESRFMSMVYEQLFLSGEPINATSAWLRLRDHWGLRVWDIDEARCGRTSASGSYADLIEAAVTAYAEKVGRGQVTRWIDHTPGNVSRPMMLREMFPDASFVHLVRDGRAVAASVLPLDWGPNTTLTAGSWWSERVTRGIAAEAIFGPDHSMRVRFEDLVVDPERTLRTICDMVGLDYDPRMTAGSGFDTPRYTAAQHQLVGTPPDQRRLNAWRDALSARQIDVFERRAWQLLRLLGYEVISKPRARPSIRETVVTHMVELVRGRAINRVRVHRRRRLAGGTE
jgi:hypothetical protein